MKISAGSIDHDQIAGVGTDDHHAIQHAIDSGASHTGDITNTQHGTISQSNAHAHSNLSGVTSDLHHAQSHTLASHPSSQASKGAVEGETDEDTYAPPNLIRNHPGVIKGRCRVFTNGTSDQGYNLTSVARNSEGDYTVTWLTDFSSTDHGWAITPQTTNVGGTVHVVGEDASTTQFRTYDSDQALNDETCAILVWGTQ